MRGILGGISSRVGPPTSTPFRMLLTASLRSDRLQFSSRRVPSGFRVDFSFFVFRLFQEKWKPRGLLRARWRPRIVCFEKKKRPPHATHPRGPVRTASFVAHKMSLLSASQPKDSLSQASHSKDALQDQAESVSLEGRTV